MKDNVLGANGIHSVEGTNGTCKKIGGYRGGFQNIFSCDSTMWVMSGYSGTCSWPESMLYKPCYKPLIVWKVCQISEG